MRINYHFDNEELKYTLQQAFEAGLNLCGNDEGLDFKQWYKEFIEQWQ